MGVNCTSDTFVFTDEPLIKHVHKVKTIHIEELRKFIISLKNELNEMNQCTCDCNYSCTCDCNYSCTCDCDNACNCDCNYSCTCDCDYCACDCNYSCTCDCNY